MREWPRLSGLGRLASFIQQLHHAVLRPDVEAAHLTLRDVCHHLGIGVVVADLALELQFDGGQETIDLRPDLPLVLRYASEQAGLI